MALQSKGYLFSSLFSLTSSPEKPHFLEKREERKEKSEKNKKKKPHYRAAFIFGDSSEIRTPDPLIKSQVLYRLS